MLDTSEIIVSKTHIEPLAEDGFIIYKLGYISPVVDGKREARMIWGNERRPNSGASAFVYVAYASDASGTGFTMTFNAALDYIAIKSTTTAIVSPIVTDFTGLWKKYNGDSAEISDTAYNATSWDGVTDVAPSKNAIRDKIESIMTLFSGYALGGWYEFSRSTIYTGTNEFQIGWASAVHQNYTFEFTLRSNTGALISVGMYHGAYSNNDTPKGVLTSIITFSSSYITNIELVDSGSFLVLKFTYSALPIGYKLKGSYTKTA